MQRPALVSQSSYSPACSCYDACRSAHASGPLRPARIRISEAHPKKRLHRSERRVLRSTESRPMPLDHVALTVSDRERSAAFYAAHFGLARRVHDDPHLLILGDGHGSLLALSEGEPAAAERLPRTNHFGFRLAGRDEVLAARERFR